jgi:hypothetical protein
MRLDQIAIVLRRRNAWEALDLGHTMLRAWAGPAYRAWLATYWLFGVPLLFILWPWQPFALMVLWWLKPVFDRVLLFTFSRCLFGTPTTVRDVWRALPALSKAPGLISGLTLRRFSMRRSFLLPVWQLEAQRGQDARQRFKILSRRTAGNAVWLTFVGANLVSIIGFSLMLVLEVLVPHGQGSLFFGDDWFGGDSPNWKHFLSNLLFMIAESLVEPLYVASGFALYLNRRSELEGWDIELAFRRLADRISSGTAPLARLVAALAIAIGLGTIAATLPDTAWAADAKAESVPRQVVKEVLADPVFGREVDETRWQARSKDGKKTKPPEWMLPFLNFIEFMSQVMRGLVWIGALLLAAVLIYLVIRYRESWLRPGRQAPPEFLFGLDVRPESLPADVVAAAHSALAAGRIEEALSLLYRGSLVVLIHRWQVDFRAGDTEDDCLRRSKGRIEGNAHNYFGELLGAWRAAAYAHRPPAGAAIENLCTGWARHFGAPAAAVERTS